MAKKLTPQTRYAVLHLPSMELVRNSKNETEYYERYDGAMEAIDKCAINKLDYTYVCFTDHWVKK